MSEIMVQGVYFEKPSRSNTERTLQITRVRAEELGIRTILVAKTKGATGVRAAEEFRGFNVVVVTHSTGFSEPNYQELTEENRQAIEAAGARILTCQHALGGVGRAVRKKLGTYELEEIIAYTLRIFGEGMKVSCEMAMMAADAGLVRTDEPVIAIAGTGRGADTAVVLRPANAQTFFDMRIMVILCKPGSLRPASAHNVQSSQPEKYLDDDDHSQEQVSPQLLPTTDGQAEKGVEDQQEEPYGRQLEYLAPHPKAVRLAQNVEMEGQKRGQSPIAPADVDEEGQVEQQTQNQEDVYEAIRPFDLAQDKPNDPRHDAGPTRLPGHHWLPTR